MLIFQVAAGLAVAMPSQAPVLYLTCETLSSPQHRVAEMYDKPLPSDDVFALDIFRDGIVAAVIPPPQSWIVDFAAGNVRPSVATGGST